MESWSVYLIRSAGGALYAGVATEVDRRLAQHRAGRGSKFLRGRGPLELVYRRKLGARSLALRVEHALKRLEKREKEALVRTSPSRRRLLDWLGIRPGPDPDPVRLRHLTVFSRLNKYMPDGEPSR